MGSSGMKPSRIAAIARTRAIDWRRSGIVATEASWLWTLQRGHHDAQNVSACKKAAQQDDDGDPWNALLYGRGQQHHLRDEAAGWRQSHQRQPADREGCDAERNRVRRPAEGGYPVVPEGFGDHARGDEHRRLREGMGDEMKKTAGPRQCLRYRK